MKNRSIVYSAIIATMYVALTLISASMGLASGAIQIRLSEALTVLPYFTPHAIAGLFIGCFISNIITGCMVLDTIFGSVATLIGAMITYLLSKVNFSSKQWLAPVGPVVSNTIIVPLVLSSVYGVKDTLWFLCLTVGIGEVLSCGVLGMILLLTLEKYKNIIFK